MWRAFRIAILLTVLAFVSLGAWVDRWRTTDWNNTLWVGVFPVNADGRETTSRYISGLESEDFGDVEDFFTRQARAWGVAVERPLRVDVQPAPAGPPPTLRPDAGIPESIWWSLKTRYYSWKVARGSLADVRVFVLYHDPERTFAVPHSLGLQKGLIGVVHAYAGAAFEPGNDVVIAHEVMHTLGATDKYDLATTQPLFPEGYAEPEASPLHPQSLAEIMAGRIPLSLDEATMPDSLMDVVVGRETAAEINWIRR